MDAAKFYAQTLLDSSVSAMHHAPCEETDRLLNAIIGNGGQASQCGWYKDKWGLTWQITPRALKDAIVDPYPAAAKRAFQAIMQMQKIDTAAIEAARRS